VFAIDYESVKLVNAGNTDRDVGDSEENNIENDAEISTENVRISTAAQENEYCLYNHRSGKSRDSAVVYIKYFQCTYPPISCTYFWDSCITA
jgi:hypothetical protein